jgi:hypothetical protein
LNFGFSDECDIDFTWIFGGDGRGG